MTTDSAAAPTKLDDVPGWFHPGDRALFTWILERQNSQESPGNVVEMGAYMGKSAIVTGDSIRDGETYTVIDLFGMPAPDEANRQQSQFYTDHLTRDAFERNYLAFHPELPTVVQAPSGDILKHVEPGSCRFVHIDASHLYERVREDIAAARTLLRPGGVVVMDDYRTEHAPGTAAAVWESMLTGGLNPIVLTGMKFYGTWDDPTEIQDELIAWAKEHPDFQTSTQEAAGQRLVRLFPVKKPAAPKAAAKPKPAAAAKPKAKPAPPPRPLLRRLALDATPPALTRAIRKARKKRAQR